MVANQNQIEQLTKQLAAVQSDLAEATSKHSQDVQSSDKIISEKVSLIAKQERQLAEKANESGTALQALSAENTRLSEELQRLRPELSGLREAKEQAVARSVQLDEEHQAKLMLLRQHQEQSSTELQQSRESEEALRNTIVQLEAKVAEASLEHKDDSSSTMKATPPPSADSAVTTPPSSSQMAADNGALTSRNHQFQTELDRASSQVQSLRAEIGHVCVTEPKAQLRFGGCLR